MRTLLSCILLSSVAVVGCTEPANEQNAEPRVLSPHPTTENRLVGQYIITLKEGASVEIIKRVFQQYGIHSIQDLPKRRYLIILKEDPGPDDIAKQAATSADIESVHPNYLYRAM